MLISARRAAAGAAAVPETSSRADFMAGPDGAAGASGEIGVGVVVFGLPRACLVQSAVVDEELKGLRHVLRPHMERAVAGVVRPAVERDRVLEPDQRGVLHPGL